MTQYSDHARIAQTLLDQQGQINDLTAAIARIRATAANSFMAGPNAVDVVRVADVLAALDEPKED